MLDMAFGGNWTQEKLSRVGKYLSAYTKILSKTAFNYAYIDAFAGTGYQTIRMEENPNQPLFQELVEDEPKQFLDGSARIALQVQPRFKRYIFVERDPKRFAALRKLIDDFPDKADTITLVNEDANAYLQKLCRTNWVKHRAVLFLDPFGMQVTWDTITAIAKTQAIDLWYLFPMGIGVNRLMVRDGNIATHWRQRLDATFGESGWYDVFYKTYIEQNLFGESQQKVVKVGGFDDLGRYVVNRLRSVFAEAADNPLFLYNSRNNPLFLLCFAAGNPKGAPTAVKIAQDILGH
jgi:three-Cys-motif partner protein